MLVLERFGVLVEYDGAPIYLLGRCITRHRFVWWWPINWLVLPLLLPVVLWRMAAARKRHNNDSSDRARSGDNVSTND